MAVDRCMCGERGAGRLVARWDCYLVGIMTLHDVDILVKLALKKQSNGLIRDIGTIHNDACNLSAGHSRLRRK